jgi:hypothetical protein
MWCEIPHDNGDRAPPEAHVGAGPRRKGAVAIVVPAANTQTRLLNALPIRHLTRAAAALVLFLPVACAFAQEHSGEGHHPRRAVAAFVGSTRAEGNSEPTVGIEAGYQINSEWSVGAVLERADRNRDSTMVLAGVGWHPGGSPFRLQLGIGRKDPAGDYETVYRIGAAYEWLFPENWLIKPYLAVDMIEQHDNETVLGIYFGKMF